ncbi:SCO1860 family LAETG-anchored protein [Streptomyces zingiberis]|uniref:LPXTG cell wall anchor domain-containing protein n=1 Tax=Streptomyces zingiberis TaxID=2053010 RepID=A0ABX1BWN2_9ACTN|nr:SCO1860 family LAETG-anchored protein [Streptomyces zingiberis]NJQ02114.1 LPXTG cell wall anchor domain-containing protein [Streptomyces zingiberis]
MNSTAFVPPARRTAAALAVAALTAGPVFLAGAAPAYASGDAAAGEGTARATVLRTELGVSLLDSVRVPLNATLNEVVAPASARETLLNARVDGAHGGAPLRVFEADVATADARTEGRTAQGRAHLVNARVHVPGLPARALIEVEKVTATAVCAAGERPTAQADVPGRVTVLGQRITLRSEGTTTAEVPGLGTVRLDLAETATTARTAAATALKLQVSVTPEKLNVASVEGTVTLAAAGCETPGGGGGTGGGDSAGGDSGGSGGSGSGGKAPQTGGEATEASGATGAASGGGDHLAATGGDSRTPYLAGGAVALLAAGGGAVFLARKRAAARRG